MFGEAGGPEEGPVPHLPSARKLLAALTCHNCHMGDSQPPLEHALPTSCCRMHSALLWEPCHLYLDLELPSAAKLQVSPSSSKITLPQGFPEKGRRLPNEWFTPSSPFCHISLHLPSYMCKLLSDVSMEHECALRSQTFIAAFSGLLVQ